MQKTATNDIWYCSVDQFEMRCPEFRKRITNFIRNVHIEFPYFCCSLPAHSINNLCRLIKEKLHPNSNTIIFCLYNVTLESNSFGIIRDQLKSVKEFKIISYVRNNIFIFFLKYWRNIEHLAIHNTKSFGSNWLHQIIPKIKSISTTFPPSSQSIRYQVHVFMQETVFIFSKVLINFSKTIRI